jgi:hypothetical protein
MAMSICKRITTHLRSNPGRQLGFCADKPHAGAKKAHVLTCIKPATSGGVCTRKISSSCLSNPLISNEFSLTGGIVYDGDVLDRNPLLPNERSLFAAEFVSD